MDTLYVVIGTTGEYSDQSEWPVCAYRDEHLAQEHITRASEVAKAIYAKSDRYGPYKDTNPYDPEMRMDYTGTGYYLWQVEVREALPVAESPTSPVGPVVNGEQFAPGYAAEAAAYEQCTR